MVLSTPGAYSAWGTSLCLRKWVRFAIKGSPDVEVVALLSQWTPYNKVGLRIIVWSCSEYDGWQ